MEEPMRTIVYIGDKSCKACKRYKETVIDQLIAAYPGNVEVHIGYDRKVGQVDAREKIKEVPMLVVEKDGCEEFRFSAFLGFDALEAIVTCESDVLTAEEALA